MPKREKNFARQVSDADFVLRKITGKGISDYAQIAWNLWGKAAVDVLIAGPVEKTSEREPEDLADCRLLGADNFYSYKVFKFAAKFFREEHHPDRFPNPGDRPRQEETFKHGEQAITRICEKRGWPPP